MADTGWVSAGLGQSIAKTGGVSDWALPTQIYSSDNLDSSAHPVPNYIQSHWLRASTFGFAIPDGATIDGIVVEFEKQCSRALMRDWQVKIVRLGSESGTNKADIYTDWPSTDTYISYGGGTDKWGLTWTPAQINATNFGVSIAVSYIGSLQTAYARVDHVRIKVYYTEPSINTKINIGDAWKDADEIKINIGDVWKPVVGIWINLGDVWRKVFG